MRNFEIIGEAAKKIPKETKQKSKEINWKRVIGMRNIVAHEYFELYLEIVWKTIEEDLKPLRKEVRKLL